MNAERFEHLAGAYGGDIRRWPADTHEGAYAFLEAHPRARAALVDAGGLDALLNAHAPAPATSMLRERILFAAPKRRPVWREAGPWAAGLAAACAAGVILGANFSGVVAPVSDPAIAQTASVQADSESTDEWFADLEIEG